MILHLLNSYLTLNLLVVLLFGVFKGFKFMSFKEQLKIQYISLGLMSAVVILQPLIPKHEYMIPAVKVWAAPTSNTQVLNPPITFMSVSSEVAAPRIEVETFFMISGLMMGLLLLWGLIKVLRELWILKKIENESLLLKAKGRTKIFVSDKILIPFSYFKPGALITMLPTSLLAHPKDFEASLFHEFQHHRQGDTKWVYPLLLLKNICFLNPFAHLLINHVQETQEFACDEVLLDKVKVNSHDYISCLIRVAQTSVQAQTEPVCATGFCFSRQNNILKRRIEMMNDKKWLPRSKSLMTVIIAGLFLLLTASVWASRNLVQDRKITMEEAQELIKNQDDFPLIVNEDVLAQLNKYVGTPEGRSFIKEALERKKNFNAVLAEKSKLYGTPDELNAIPIVESGFVNRTSSGRIKAAGLWMFIPATARRYGMKVNKSQDERLNVEKETDAAQRYLVANHLLFNDWHLSLLAYNVGEGTVKKGIEKFKTRNAWELLAKGVEGDKNYLPSVMAAMIIMKNPELLKN